MDFGKILGSLIESGLSGSSRQRTQNVFGYGGGFASGVFGNLGDVGGALSGMIGGKSGQGGGMLGDVMGQAMQLLGNNKHLALDGLGALAGSLMGGGGKRSVNRNLGSGAMALLGSLAFSALKSSMKSVEDVPLGLRQPRNSQEQEQLDQDTELVLKAMINAAKADGRIDRAEIERITGKLEKTGEEAETREFVMAELKRPFDLRSIVTACKQPQTAAQVYAASLLAIEVDTVAEKRYLEQLADGLGLSRQTVSRLENAVGL